MSGLRPREDSDLDAQRQAAVDAWHEAQAALHVAQRAYGRAYYACRDLGLEHNTVTNGARKWPLHHGYWRPWAGTPLLTSRRDAVSAPALRRSRGDR